MACVFTFADGSQFIPDAYTTATHAVTTEATQFPVSDGATITDHVIVKPREISLDLIVSPWSPEPRLLQPPEANDRPLTAWNLLTTVASTRQPFTAEIDGQTYKPVVILSLNRTHTYDDGESYRFSCQLQQILVATAQTVPAASLSADIRHKGSKRNRGTQQPVPANPGLQAIGEGAQGIWQGLQAAFTPTP